VHSGLFQFVAKLFSGIGVGSLQFVTPTYVSEVAPVRVRGLLLMLYNFWSVTLLRPTSGSEG